MPVIGSSNWRTVLDDIDDDLVRQLSSSRTKLSSSHTQPPSAYSSPRDRLSPVASVAGSIRTQRSNLSFFDARQVDAREDAFDGVELLGKSTNTVRGGRATSPEQALVSPTTSRNSSTLSPRRDTPPRRLDGSGARAKAVANAVSNDSGLDPSLLQEMSSVTPRTAAVTVSMHLQETHLLTVVSQGDLDDLR
jgi:hypothetical protein